MKILEAMKITKIIAIGFISSFLFVSLSAQLIGQITMEKEGLKRHYVHEGEEIDKPV
jgi:hypothetical protein